MRSGIYWIRNTRSGKCYIGSSDNIRRRWWNHRSELRRGIHSNKHLQRAWSKDGEAVFKFEVLEEVDQAQLLRTEQWYLNNTKCLDVNYGYNCDPVAGRHVHSEETKRRLREINRGRIMSPESRKRMSEAWTDEKRKTASERISARNRQISWNRGKKLNLSDEQRLNLSLRSRGKSSFRGKRHTEQTKDIIRQKALGRPCSKDTRLKLSKAVEMIDPDGNVLAIFSSQTDAAKAVGRKLSCISATTRGVNKTCGGKCFRFRA